MIFKGQVPLIIFKANRNWNFLFLSCWYSNSFFR